MSAGRVLADGHQGASPFGSAIFSERSSVFRAPGLGPGGRRWKSCRSDHFTVLPWSNTSGTRLLSGLMQVGILPAAPLPGSVKVARRPVKPFGVGASPTLAAIFQGVMSAADGLVRNQEAAGACISRNELPAPGNRLAGLGKPTHATLTILWKAGRFKLAAPVLKTGSASPRSEHYRRLPSP